MGGRSGLGFPGGWERQRIHEARVARLATVRPDGRPHLVPVTYAVVGDLLVTAVDAKPKSTPNLQRLRNVAAHPSVCLLVDAYDEDWANLWWVRLEGEADVVGDGEARASLLPPLVAKYAQYRANPPDGPVIRIRVTAWASWEPR
jgi:PPOX class probable F420-dependent enzyme